MANSRLERIGTIFTRVEGLLRCKAMHPEDRPIWWDIYRAFPPTREPVFDRTISAVTIRPIYYKEDIIRAKYHKSGEPIGTVNLSDTKSKTNVQQLLDIHETMKNSDNENEESLYFQAMDVLKESIGVKREDWLEKASRDTETKKSFASTFAEAKKDQTDLKDIFKE
ncbi:mitochondrial ribosomal protein S23 [Arctopsyche grandis]|uniref:mitochondrial ribosomal protein S23 n=1 Tax=Arctopsyche grandis TaxID=121162 RepID=UPI00406D917F